MAIKLSNGHFKAAAAALKIHPAIVKSVAMNESPNAGFDASGRPIILFERHKFDKFAGEILGIEKRKDIRRLNPDICNPKSGGYGPGGDHQWKRFSKAFLICKPAAMMACSWGSFQEMGFNFAQIGFDSIDQFVDAMKLGLEAHLAIFIVSIRKKGLLKFLQKAVPDFHGFAEGYNGSEQEKNDYEGKMKRGYATYKKLDWEAVEPLPLVTISDLKRRTLRLATMLVGSPDMEGVAPEDNADLDQQNNLNEQPELNEDTNQLPNQTAENITNVQTGEQKTPPGFVAENKELNAPAKEGTTQTAATVTILGIAVPGVIVGVIKAVQDVVSQGYISASDVGGTVITFISNNQKYAFFLIALIILILILKKLFKQITLWIQIFILADPNKHNVTVIPFAEALVPTNLTWIQRLRGKA